MEMLVQNADTWHSPTGTRTRAMVVSAKSRTQERQGLQGWGQLKLTLEAQLWIFDHQRKFVFLMREWGRSSVWLWICAHV